MAVFSETPEDVARLHYRLLQNGALVLYPRATVLTEDVDELRRLGFAIDELDAGAWTSSDDLHSALAAALSPRHSRGVLVPGQVLNRSPSVLCYPSIGQLTYAGRFRLTGLPPRLEDGLDSIARNVVWLPEARGERPFRPGPSRGVDLLRSARARRPESSEKRPATTARMMNAQTVVQSLSASDLLSATRELVQRSCDVEAELLVHLGEIDERKLYLDSSFSSMFAFCVGEFGFSEGAAYNRIMVARAAREITKREVFERDGGRCTFTDLQGRRCAETGALEFDHRDGFARTRLHQADRIRLLCRAHNQHAAEQMYGRAFMERARASVDRPAAAPGTPSG